MKRILIMVFILTTILGGCVSAPVTASAKFDENGVLVVSPVIPMTASMGIMSFLTSYAFSKCSAEPQFRGCADIFCQIDVHHKHCTSEAINRLRKKGVRL